MLNRKVISVERRMKASDAYFMNGLYCGCYFKANKPKLVIEFLDALKDHIEAKIKESVPEFTLEKVKGDPYHFTIMYSTNAPSESEIYAEDLPEDVFPHTVEVYFLGFEVYPYGDSYCIAITLNKDENIMAMHEYFKKRYGLIHSHPDYTPHVTIGLFDKKYESDVKSILKDLSVENPNDERVFSYVEYKIESANDE